MATKTDKPRAPRPRKATVTVPGHWNDEQRRLIAERAYHLFLQRGGGHGYELDDWLKAEAEFAASLKKQARKTKTAG